MPKQDENWTPLEVLSGLVAGRYSLRVAEDDPSLRFPPGFSFRHDGKLFVLFPEEKPAQEAMGVSVVKD